MEYWKNGRGEGRKSLCDGRELDMPFGVWFSSKISVDGCHLFVQSNFSIQIQHENTRRKTPYL